MKRLKQAMLMLWFESDVPVTARPPDEIAGVMQDDLEETQDFAAAVLAAHWAGECLCQSESGGRLTPIVSLRERP